jgi:hypothetical protein
MNVYRIYVLNSQDRVADEIEQRYASDRMALERAEDLSAGQYAAEVWAGERLVARLGPEFEITSAG